MYRKALAFKGMKKYEEALEAVGKAFELNKTDVNVRKLLKELKI